VPEMNSHSLLVLLDPNKLPTKNTIVIYPILCNCIEKPDHLSTSVAFIAQLVRSRASHRYHEVTGSNPVEVLTFSGFSIRNCLSCVHNCEDHILLHFSSAVRYMEHLICHFAKISM